MAFEKNMGESSNSKHINLMRTQNYSKSHFGHILKNVAIGIEKLNEEKFQCMDRETEPIITFYNTEEDELAKMPIDHSEKRTWVSSFQLWTTPVECEENQQYISSMCYEGEQLGSGLTKGKEGAFVAFNKNPPTSGVTIKDDVMVGVDDEKAIGGGLIKASPQQQEQKKQRRCWYPELHRAFVHAIDEIGGVEVATPKRILEKMKAEGLTSDEVKSHLQKYRIHIRRLASASSTGPSNSQFLTNKEVSDNDGSNNMQEEVVKSKIWGNQVDF